MSSSDDRALRSGAIIVWREIAEPGIAAWRPRKASRFARPPLGKLTVPSEARGTNYQEGVLQRHEPIWSLTDIG
jgi:hypothetical protein